MNTTPRPPTIYPTEFRQIISEKSANFVGREFVFSAINNFLSRQNRGYFTIVGAPGSGKSAILAKYVSENPQVIYYNAEVAGKNRADEFLAIVGSQLRRRIGNGNASEGDWLLSLLLQKASDLLSPDERLIIAIDGLDRIDTNHQPLGTNLFYLPRYLPDKVYFILTRRPFLREKSGLLIEAPFEVLDLEKYPEENREDVREYVRRNLTPPTPLPCEGRGEEEEEENSFSYEGRGEEEEEENFFPYEGRGEEEEEENSFPYEETGEEEEEENSFPCEERGEEEQEEEENSFPYEKRGEEKEEENASLLPKKELENSSFSPSPRRGGGWGERSNSSLTTDNINQQKLIEQLITKSDNNFMYISEVLPIIAERLVVESLGEELRNPVSLGKPGFLSPGLAAYYENHWQQMIGNSLDSIPLAVINILSQQEEPISAASIAEMIDEDEYDVEEILENWREFLHLVEIDREIRYSFYHFSFREWLRDKLNNSQTIPN